jgi:hypothetical protein
LCEKIPGFKLPLSIRKAVASLNIRLHRLAFACYTPELNLKDWRNMRRFFAAIDVLYSAYSELKSMSVKEFLDIKVTQDGTYSIRFEKSVPINADGQQIKYWSLSLYNKGVEIEETRFVRGTMSKGTSDNWLKSRMRLDLTLFNRWFAQNNLKTVREIQERCKDIGWKEWMYSLLEDRLNEVKLEYILSFKLSEVEIQKGPYRKEYDLWRKGLPVGKVSSKCKAWFKEQGLDIEFPLNLHYVIGLQRAVFLMGDGSDDTAILGDKEAIERSKTRLEDGLTNKQFLPIAARAHLITPDRSFGTFTREVRAGEEVFIDPETGHPIKS